MSRTPSLVGALALTAVVLGGCEQMSNAIGLKKQVPDEFAVVARAPLSMPPDYRLRVPVPGAKRPQESSTRDAARDILVNRSARRSKALAPSAGQFSSGETALLKRAGALSSDPSIRQTVDRESSALADAEKSVFDKVVFWRKPAEPGTVVDAGKESRRLREATALGDAPNKGDVPVIERRERGLLEGLF
ncbi:MAG: DUF3035 domain-containing protein [Alphaproteobacteria bacterium]